jgi:hypothetical protein
MAATQFIAARVTSETKARFRALAEQQQLTEPVLLKRMIDLIIQSVGVIDTEGLSPVNHAASGARVCIRLRPEDQLLLRERASARQMATATYVSVLLRSHLRALPPLPKDELFACKEIKSAHCTTDGLSLSLCVAAKSASGRMRCTPCC